MTSLVLLSGALLALLASGIWIAITLLAVGILALALFTPASMAGSMAISVVWDASWNWVLTALPLFVWMGEILSRSRIAEGMFRGLAPWVGWLPGRLLHVNVIGCGVMAAVTGSSAVTCAAVGRMSLPELQRLGYDRRMSIGTLAGAGTLGLLIPPSVMMIVYGVVAQQSIARLFIAGVVPGILLMLLFSAYVVGWSLLNPDRTVARLPRMSLAEKLRKSLHLFPVMVLIGLVLFSIYGGYATPTEAAAVGVLGSLLIAWLSGDMSWQSFQDGLLATTKTSCMLSFIIASAGLMAIAMGFTGVPAQMASWVSSLELSPYMLIIVLTLLYIVLGCFLDGISMLVLTAAVVLPMVQTAGIDLIWFGIYLIVVVEMAQITPPVGMNLFVLNSLTGSNIWAITRATFPFFLVLLVFVAIITAFPQIALWLPQTMMAAP